MLQPLEELQACKAPARKSINLNYGSLPPQLVVLKALRSGHFVLAAVCSMVLLANLLAIALAGLFNQDSRQIWNATSFSPPFEAKFVSINGSIGPATDGFHGSVVSGAFHGGQGQDQFLIAESNYTSHTQLPAWTDDRMLYLPFFSTAANTSTDDIEYQARTQAYGAELDCEELSFGINYYANLAKTPYDDTNMYLNVSVSSGSTTVNCSGENSLRPGPLIDALTAGLACSKGLSAAEFITQLAAGVNATQEEKDICTMSVVFGWIRVPDGSCGGIRDRDLDASNSLFVRCRPRLVAGRADVVVNAKGQLVRKPQVARMDPYDNDDELKQHFSNDPMNLLSQSNLYLFPITYSVLHNDTFASDTMNHFVIRESNNKRLVDPNQSVPSFEDVNRNLTATHSRLFAIWLGANKENLLVSAQGKGLPILSGWTIEISQRLFLSTIMFAIAEGIICTYAIVAILVYLRRPGKYLARLPTCIASIIALFAASAAIQDMTQTSRYDKKERGEHLERLGSRYGYGSYVGSDGRVHIGIEKAPFVRIRSNSTWFEKKVKSFRSSPGV